MDKPSADEAIPIVEATLIKLLTMTPTRGRIGSDLRRVVGDVLAHVEVLLRNDRIGPPLNDCFVKAEIAGVTVPQLAQVRMVAAGTSPVTLGATLIKNSLIEFILATEGSIIADTKFVSHDDVEALKLHLNDVFMDIEEVVADEMDSMTYRAVVALHAAINFYLIESQRPLPRMVGYRFAAPYPSLRIAHWLYADASRADELRAENKIVHPAFCPMLGKALSG